MAFARRGAQSKPQVTQCSSTLSVKSNCHGSDDCKVKHKRGLSLYVYPYIRFYVVNSFYQHCRNLIVSKGCGKIFTAFSLENSFKLDTF